MTNDANISYQSNSDSSVYWQESLVFKKLSSLNALDALYS